MSPRGEQPARARLSFSAGGWIIALALVLVTAATLWRLHDMLGSRGRRATGDGRDPASYGFDLADFAGDRAQLAASGLPRDGIPVLDFPPSWSLARVDSLAHAGRNKYLVSNDRVIGVVAGGHARAYPLMILNWHEVVNDTLGGVPIAVTYSPLCDAAAVYLRGAGEAPIRLGYSGLMYNSNALLYDRRDGHAGESLYNQVTGEPMAGPARGRSARLPALPCALVRWADWKAREPGTTVLWRDPARLEAYKREPYVAYLGDERLRFPVAPLPPADGLSRKELCLVLGEGSAAVVLPLSRLAGRVDPGGSWRTDWEGEPLVIHWQASPPTAWVESPAGRPGPAVRYACWFAWFAMRDGEVRLLD